MQKDPLFFFGKKKEENILQISSAIMHSTPSMERWVKKSK
jgi:hypothetical protein